MSIITLPEAPQKGAVKVIFQHEPKGVPGFLRTEYTAKLGQVARDRNKIFVGTSPPRVFSEDVPFDPQGMGLYLWEIAGKKVQEALASGTEEVIFIDYEGIPHQFMKRFMKSLLGNMYPKTVSLRLYAPEVQEYIFECFAFAKSYAWMMEQIDAASNILTPGEFARRILSGYPDAVVLKGEELLKANLSLTHRIGQSPRATNLKGDFEPHFVRGVIGAKNARRKITMLLKGVTFDTGGLNLKSGPHMSQMNKDMAAVAYGLAVISQLKGLLEKHGWCIEFLIPLVENGFHVYPGEVYNIGNVSVHIGNTDAEGRLILADAAQVIDPTSEIIISAATMTGSAAMIGQDRSVFAQGDMRLVKKFVDVSAHQGVVNFQVPTHPGVIEHLMMPDGAISNVMKGAILQAPYLFINHVALQLHSGSLFRHMFLDLAGPGIKGGMLSQMVALQKFMEELIIRY